MKSAIYTRSGDDGTTGLADGSRVKKDSLRLNAYGTIDEAGAHLGLAQTIISDEKLSAVLSFLAHRLFNCSSHLSFANSNTKAAPQITQEDVDLLEQAIDFMDTRLPPLAGFVLCGGKSTNGAHSTGEAAAGLHLARTVIRRAERLICSLNEQSPVDPVILKFINRASDLLFAAARYQNFLENIDDTLWQKDIAPPIL